MVACGEGSWMAGGQGRREAQFSLQTFLILVWLFLPCAYFAFQNTNEENTQKVYPPPQGSDHSTGQSLTPMLSEVGFCHAAGVKPLTSEKNKTENDKGGSAVRPDNINFFFLDRRARTGRQPRAPTWLGLIPATWSAGLQLGRLPQGGLIKLISTTVGCLRWGFCQLAAC